MGTESTDSQEKRKQALEMAERRGIPVRLARQVVEGNMTMGQVMRKLMQRKKMESIASKHGLSRSLAGNVAVGEMTVEQALMRQKFHQHVQAHGDRSVFDEMLASEQPVVLAICGQERVRGKLRLNDPYEVKIEERSGNVITLPKLDVKFAHLVAASEQVREALNSDRKIRKQGLEPVRRIEKRYHIKNRELIVIKEKGRSLRCTLLEGEIIEGRLEWFSRYELKVNVAKDVAVYVMRHAIIHHGSGS